MLAPERTLEEMLKGIESLCVFDPPRWVQLSPKYAMELIAAVRAALLPRQRELPPLDVTDEDYEEGHLRNGTVARNEVSNAAAMVIAKTVSRERQLRAAYAEIERLKFDVFRLVEVAKGVRRSIGLEPHAETTVQDAMVVPAEVEHGVRQIRSTSHASGKQEGRKECLDAVLGLGETHGWRSVGRNDAYEAILALPKVGE